ncbi:gliding motility-associated C-terminal domain-containing protein [Hymenobacter sp. UYCo722]|uniref:T9SS type B sorting domain-containing protein n=1 Tax=Hymenobacter sp. UYCo722 TaxID=3156335 RepID=UPI003391D09F
MRILTCYFFLLTLWLIGAGPARAQSCLAANPPACTFELIDDNGLSVNALCVGKRVKFQPCANRNPDIYRNIIRYGVLPGVGSTFINSTPLACTPDRIYPAYYTPTLADVGMVTVSELANDNGSKYYIRTFRVYDTTPPPFTIAPCPTGSALVTVTDTKFDSYQVQAGSGPSQAISRNQPTVLVVPAGAATITVTGRYAIPEACEGTNNQALRAAAAPVTPGFSSLTLAGPLPGGAATLAVSQLPADYQYTLQIADGTAPGGFRDVMPVAPGSSSISLPAPAAGCYRVSRIDLCGTSPAASPLICTLSLSGTSARNRNQLLLADAGAGNTYSITRNGQALNVFSVIPGGFEDADVQCGSTYTYVVTARQPGGGAAVSNQVSIATVSALPPQQPKLVASFNLRNVVELTPLLVPTALPAGSSLRYFRTVGTTTTDFGTASTLRAPRDSADLAVLRAAPPCYTVRLLDVCGNASPLSAPACPSLLTAAAGTVGIATELTWTPFSGPDPNQQAIYLLQFLNADGTVRSVQPVSGNTYTDLAPPTDQTISYRLQISGAGLPAGTFSYSNLASVARTPALTIPTAFTPNGDGLNDVLEVKGSFLGNYTFVVVDRSGQEVFRGTKRSDTWDGRIAGRAPVPGSYVWRFQQASDNGQPYVRSGAVTILR